MNPFPTSVNTEITEHPDQGRIILKIDDRIIGCKLAKRIIIQEAELILKRWWENENNRQWQWGDFILQCEDKFGEEQLTQIIPDNDIAAQTLANWSSVAKQYAHSERIYDVRWSIYAECAYIWDRTLRAKLLLWAEETAATVQEVRAMKKKLTETAQDAPTLNEPPQAEETYQEFSSDEISGIFAGNIKPLIRLFATWRSKVQSGRRYRIILQEV